MSAARSERFIFNSQLKKERDYWIDRLSQPSEGSTLRPDFERTVHPLGVKHTFSFTIPDETARKLNEFTAGSPLLLYATLLAALKVCLYKYTGSRSIVIGSPSLLTSNGTTPKPNVLAIVDPIDSHKSFERLLENVRQTLDDAYARQQYPFERLITDLGLKRKSPGFPLFDIAMALENIHDETPDIENDLTILVASSADKISGEIKYQPEVFSTETIELFAAHFINTVAGAIAAPQTLVRDVQMLTPGERHQLITDWNRTNTAYEKDRCVHELIEAQTLRTPAAVAVVCGAQELTYQQLNERANSLARYLQSCGVGVESRVAICTGRSVEMIVGVLGTLKAGAAYVPLDPDYPAQRLTYMLCDSKAQVLLTVTELLEQLPESDALKVCLDTACEKFGEYSSAPLMNKAHPENIAYIIYTSGSTGQPKGVLISHQGLTNLVSGQSRAFNVTQSSRVLQFAPFGFDSSVTEIFTTLYGGASIYLEPRGATQLAADITKVLRDAEITCATIPPALLAVTEVEPLPLLETLVVAGEACPVEVVERWGRGRQFLNAYGPTENTVCAAVMECDDVYTKSVPIGRPLPNIRLYILDRDMQPVPVGVAGELYIGGDSLARGYLSQPDLTAEKFVPDPFSRDQGRRLYRSGDLTRWLPDGVVEFLGRIDRQVKVRGFRVELGEVETAIKRMPGVSEVVAELASDGQSLVAYVVRNGTITTEQIRDWLQTHLPPFMVPGQVVLLERLPWTRHGKVDHAALRALAENTERNDHAGEGGAPLSETEQTVADVWCAILGIDGLGRQANFFDLGGQSLLATQVTTRIRNAFGLDVPVDVLFEHATVAGFAAQLDAIQQANAHSQAPGKLTYPLEEGEL